MGARGVIDHPQGDQQGNDHRHVGRPTSPTTWRPRPHSPPRLARRLYVVLLLAVIPLYTATAAFADLVAARNGASPWFPPAGLSLACTLVFGWPGAAVVAVADTFQLIARDSGIPGWACPLLGVLQGAIWGVVGSLLHRRISLNRALETLSDVLWFALLGIITGAALNALITVTALVGLGEVAPADHTVTMGQFFVGDSIGVLAITPALLSMASWLAHPDTVVTKVRRVVGRSQEILVVAALMMGWAVGSIMAFDGSFLPVASLPLVLIALRYGMPTAGIAALGWTTCGVAVFGMTTTPIDLTRIDASLVAGGLLALAVGSLVTERERARARMAYLALHDDVTGLPNQRHFLSAVTDALSRHRQDDIAVLVIRLTALHEMASTSQDRAQVDRMLRYVATQLINHTSAEATIARLGPSRFVIMVEGQPAKRADELGRRLLALLSTPMPWKGREQLLGPVIGVAHGGGDKTPTQMMDQATKAAGMAEGSEHPLALFDEQMTRRDVEWSHLERDLRHAVTTDNQLYLVFQPILTIATGQPAAVEALLRWHHPIRGEVDPSYFIPIAEAHGLILPLGRWVLHQACRAAARWASSPNEEPLRLHVNVSAIQLRDERFPAQVTEILDLTGFPAQRLCLEITESAVVDDLPTVGNRLERLRELGISVALDDFGTGHSSLTWLQKLPINIIKVDRSFVTDLSMNAVDEAIVSATINLAHTLDLTTVGEGVETSEQLGALAQAGCQTVQGFYLSRPIPESAFVEWLERDRSR